MLKRVEITFCRRDNLEPALKFLAQELCFKGYPGLPKYEPSRNEVDVMIGLINNLWLATKQQEAFKREREELQAEISRLLDSNKKLNSIIDKSKKQIDEVQSFNGTIKLKQSKLMTKIASLEYDLKSEKQEVSKLRGKLDSFNRQFFHDVQKRDNEIDRLQSLICSKANKEIYSQFPVDLRKKLEKAKEQKLKNMIGPDVESEYIKSIRILEKNLQDLIVENVCWRQAMKTQYSQIVSVLLPEKFCEDNSFIESGLNFDLPYENFIRIFHKQWLLIIKRIALVMECRADELKLLMKKNDKLQSVTSS